MAFYCLISVDESSFMLYLKLQRLQFIQLTTPFNTNQLCENTSIYYRPKITTLRDNGTTPRDNGNMEYVKSPWTYTGYRTMDLRMDSMEHTQYYK